MCLKFKLVHEVFNGIFYPVSFGFQFNLVYIIKGNNYELTKYQMPLGMNE
jgi:hypothetical protein